VKAPFSRLPPARRRQARAVLAVVAVVLLAVAGWGVVRAVGSGGTEADQSAPGPVLVVPGYGGNVDELVPLVDELRREGRDVTVYEPTDGNTGDLRAQAHRLADLAARRMQDTGASSVDLVGYSAGGVVVRLFVRDDGGSSVVRRVLTLGSPHHGTDVAALAEDVAGGCPTACEQLATGSDLLRRLNAGDETPSGPVWATVRTERDTVVTPVDSAVLSGALNLSVQEFCAGARTTHGDLPGDPVVLAALPAVLGTGAPHRPARVGC
jgi:triacylglycerol lipase